MSGLFLKMLLHLIHFDLSFIHSPHKILLHSVQFKGSKGNLLQLEHNNLGILTFSFSSNVITLSLTTLYVLTFVDCLDKLDFFDFNSSLKSSSYKYLLL